MNEPSVVAKIDKAVKNINRNAPADQIVGESCLTDLIHSVMRLAVFALEKGRLPDEVQLAEIYQFWYKKIDQKQHLDEKEISRLGEYYRILELELTPVTAVSLRATDCSDFNDCMKSAAGRFAKSQWLLTYIVFGLIATLNLFQYIFEFLFPQWAVDWPTGLTTLTFVYQLSNDLIPFTYGTLGACAHVLRLTDQRIRDREFDPRKVPEHRNRLVLGTLSGGVIVMFFSAGEANTGNIALTAAALGFLAGYSTDFLFSIIDRILNALSPRNTKDDKAAIRTATRTKSNQLNATKNVG